MNIHEYQAKAVLRDFGVPVPRGIPAFSVEEAVKGARSLGGPVWVVKAQIHAGGRGKAGGVKVVKSVDDVEREAQRLLGAKGVERIVEIELNGAEKAMFEKSVDAVRGLVDACTKIAPNLAK